MKKTIVVGFALVVVAALASIASQAGAAEKGGKGGKAVLIPANELKWTDAAEFAGVKVAVVHGDPSKGPHHSFIKLPGGFTTPLHHHTSDHYATLLSGTLVFTVDGQDRTLPAGSFFEYTGKKPHVTKCEAGADCVIFNDCRGKWDVVPEGGKASKM